MKKLNRLKLNTLENENLSDREMKKVKGGWSHNCSCSCYWANQGGANENTNGNANLDKSTGDDLYFSAEGENQWHYMTL